MKKLKKILSEKGLLLIPLTVFPLAFSMYYTLAALSYGENPLKPRNFFSKRREVLAQREVQKEQELRDYSREQFHKADKNGNFVLDPNEFSNYLEKYHNY